MGSANKGSAEARELCPRAWVPLRPPLPLGLVVTESSPRAFLRSPCDDPALGSRGARRPRRRAPGCGPRVPPRPARGRVDPSSARTSPPHRSGPPPPRAPCRAKRPRLPRVEPARVNPRPEISRPSPPRTVPALRPASAPPPPRPDPRPAGAICAHVRPSGANGTRRGACTDALAAPLRRAPFVAPRPLSARAGAARGRR